jgi:blue copper oxidase
MAGGQSLALHAREAQVDLGGGHMSSGLVYDLDGASGRRLIGPTLVAGVGDDIDVTLHNHLADHTTVHWHGLLAPPDADGQPHDHVEHGAEHRYAFPVLAQQRPSFNWYHPHPHGHVGAQVARGLAGGFVIIDPAEVQKGLPVGDAYDIPLVVRDVQLDATGEVVYEPSPHGASGTSALVNGTLQPYLEVEPAVYRFRLLNGSTDRISRLAMGDAAPLRIIANDGGLLPEVASVAEILLSPAERVEILLDLRDRTGISVLRDLATGWDLLELRVGGESAQGELPELAPVLSHVAPLPPAELTRQFSFDGMSRINGKTYEMDRIDFRVPFGSVERWRFTSRGNMPHPVHVHGTHFQVVRRTGRGARNAVQPWELGWKDTVLLQPGETVEVLIRFDAYPGRYMMHCHLLVHEDAGMMLNFEVV